MQQTLTQRRPRTRIPPLIVGDNLDQKAFHERYKAMPAHVKAELVEGIVYMPSPLGMDHGWRHSKLNGWLEAYIAATPGTEAFNNTTTILSGRCEVQPDCSLALRPECGGQSRSNKEGYLEGPPELISEVSHSSESYDMHGKLRDYEDAGVIEYLVVLLRKEEIVWHTRHGNSKNFSLINPTRDGIYRSEFYPGLWLDADALFRGDSCALHAALKKGLATPEHAKFVQSLKRMK
jgi:Uma2 family endonuclease